MSSSCCQGEEAVLVAENVSGIGEGRPPQIFRPLEILPRFAEIAEDPPRMAEVRPSEAAKQIHPGLVVRIMIRYEHGNLNRKLGDPDRRRWIMGQRFRAVSAEQLGQSPALEPLLLPDERLLSFQVQVFKLLPELRSLEAGLSKLDSVPRQIKGYVACKVGVQDKPSYPVAVGTNCQMVEKDTIENSLALIAGQAVDVCRSEVCVLHDSS